MTKRQGEWACRIGPAAALTLLLPVTAEAATGWSFRVSPALWVPGVDAQVDLGGRRAAETQPGVLDGADLVGFVEAEARWQRVGIVAELTFLDVDEAATAAGGRIPAVLDIDGETASLAAFARVVASDRWAVDALVGGRYWSIDAEVGTNALPAVSSDQTWADPIAGARVVVAPHERLTLALVADVGGFGIGSDFQWEVVGRAGLELGRAATLGLGWRHLAVEYEERNVALDFALSGPFIALDLTF